MGKKLKIEFYSGEIAYVEKMDSNAFAMLQDKYKSAIKEIDGEHPAFWRNPNAKPNKITPRITITPID
jgi:hypothetical protein